jgi:hypothetical protein
MESAPSGKSVLSELCGLLSQGLNHALRSPLLPRLMLILPLIGLTARVPGPVVHIGEPRTVVTTNPKMGVHTRLTDEVEEWKIKRTLEMVREMGASWIVEYFPWGYYEPEKGRFDWSHPDLVVDHALAQGLQVVARIDFVPDWARPPDTTYRYLPEESYDDYADFVYTFVEHFRERVHYVVIWNEPNLAFEWGYRLPDPAAYTRLLQAAYRRAKDADPNVTVLAAGLAPTLAPPGSEWGMDDLLFLQQMYDAGARGFFDGLAIHAYGWTLSPDAEASETTLGFSRASLLHEVLVRNGDGDLPCYITEAGWNDNRRWANAVRPALRIDYTVRAYEKVLEEWSWCRMVAMWVFRYPRPARTYQDDFTFVTPGFVSRPIYDAVQAYARGELP